MLNISEATILDIIAGIWILIWSVLLLQGSNITSWYWETCPLNKFDYNVFPKGNMLGIIEMWLLWGIYTLTQKLLLILSFNHVKICIMFYIVSYELKIMINFIKLDPEIICQPQIRHYTTSIKGEKRCGLQLHQWFSIF